MMRRWGPWIVLGAVAAVGTAFALPSAADSPKQSTCYGSVSDGALRGFSAPGGIELKRKMLEMEGAL